MLKSQVRLCQTFSRKCFLNVFAAVVPRCPRQCCPRSDCNLGWGHSSECRPQDWHDSNCFQLSDLAGSGCHKVTTDGVCTDLHSRAEFLPRTIFTSICTPGVPWSQPLCPGPRVGTCVAVRALNHRDISWYIYIYAHSMVKLMIVHFWILVPHFLFGLFLAWLASKDIWMAILALRTYDINMVMIMSFPLRTWAIAIFQIFCTYGMRQRGCLKKSKHLGVPCHDPWFHGSICNWGSHDPGYMPQQTETKPPSRIWSLDDSGRRWSSCPGGTQLAGQYGGRWWHTTGARLPGKVMENSSDLLGNGVACSRFSQYLRSMAVGARQWIGSTIKWVRPQHFILWVHFIFWGA